MEDTFFEALSFKPDHESEFPTTIRSTLLGEIARNFQVNIVIADELLHMPLVPCLAGDLVTNRLAVTAQVMAKTGAYRVWETSEPARKGVEDEVDRRLNEMHPQIRRATEQKLRTLFQDKTLRSSMRALILSTLSSVWTSFECPAKDTWIALVNAHPRELGQRAIQGLEDASSIEG